ncbi:MAG: peptidyl-prolyl cis-trans isomerase [Chitinispirillia bacterium]|nr:peptidyl-prolyl cis-trans isomerase [Chitinispirillia bacterium]
MNSPKLQKAARTAVLALSLVSALSITAFTSCNADKKSHEHTVAMVVNGKNVTQQQVSDAVELFRSQQMMSPEMLFMGDEGMRRGAARSIVGNMLLVAEVESRGWKADSAVVDRMAARFMAQFPSREEFLAQLQAMGESEESMRKGMAEELLIDSLMRTVSSSVPPVDSLEALAHYEANKSRYTAPGQIRASQIIFALEPTASDSLVRVVVERAGEAQAKAAAGEDFDKLVKEYSSDPKNSDLGWFSRGQLVPEIERALFTLKTGEVSGPVPSGMGIHLLKKTGEQEPRLMPFEEARGRIMRTLEMNRQAKTINDYVEGLINAANIKFVDATLDFMVQTGNADTGADTSKTGRADTSAAIPVDTLPAMSAADPSSPSQ